MVDYFNIKIKVFSRSNIKRVYVLLTFFGTDRLHKLLIDLRVNGFTKGIQDIHEI